MSSLENKKDCQKLKSAESSLKIRKTWKSDFASKRFRKNNFDYALSLCY